jgi:hypothetical protein
MTLAYHPQSNRQLEKVSQCLETYLRCMSMNNPKQWCLWMA